MKVSSKVLKIKEVSSDLLVFTLRSRDLKVKLSKKGTKSSKSSKAVSFQSCADLIGRDLLKELKRQEFKGESGQEALFRIPGMPWKALLLVGRDQKKPDGFEKIDYYRKLGERISKTAAKLKIGRVALSGENLDLKDQLNAAAVLEGVQLADYSFDRYKSRKKGKKNQVSELILVSKQKISQKCVRGAKSACESTALARDLINMPGCDCTPAYLVKTCRSVARAGKLKITVFDKNRLQKMKAGSLLSVAQGSPMPPYLIKMVYSPKKKNPKVISIVGKGITFDSGGLSLKPSAGMYDMKSDMSGAAAVIGAMNAIAMVKPGVEVRGYVPTCENMPGGKATRPGDIVKAMNGKSIEILNTDAEGRLILADALCLAVKDGCDQVIDLATLTGACVVALGEQYAALFSKDRKIEKGLLEAAEKTGERFWPMPLPKEYEKLLKSPVADVQNISSTRWGGAITAALFLKNFVSETPWAHLDIAGPAYAGKKGGVGFAVRTLVEYIKVL